MKQFLSIPTLGEWRREFKVFGWDGSDGSSSSSDDIEGIRIGITSRKLKDLCYPANLHDWRYQLGRRKKLPEKFRKAADQGYRDGCLEWVSALIGFSGWKARARCHVRYYGLRVLGYFSWRGKW